MLRSFKVGRWLLRHVQCEADLLACIVAFGSYVDRDEMMWERIREHSSFVTIY